jgi:dTDP-4-amino-4,6-dideoxygalactose transaminase
MPEKLALYGGPKAVPDDAVRKWPCITTADKQAVMRVMDYGLFSHDTPEVDALQKEWAAYVGVKHCLATNSGTAALHMSVAAAGIGPGDEVIVPAYTFVASGTAVLHHNAIPVFVDVEPDTWNIDVRKIESAITPYTKAIMPVHLNGYPADMDEINAIAKRHKLVVIEDACQAHGALYHGRKTGSLGDLGGFSLNSWKNLPAGDGGLFVTNDDEYADRAGMVREFGERIYKGKKREYRSYAMGWMYRTTELVAAFARSQLARLDEMNEWRYGNALMLRDALAQYDFITLPKYRDDRTCVYWFFPFMFSAKKAGFDVPEVDLRQKLSQALSAEGLRCGSWQTLPLPAQAIFHDKIGYGKGSPWSDSNYKGNVSYNPEEYPVAWTVAEQTLWLANLFFWPQTREEVGFAVKAFDKVFRQLDQVVRYQAPAGS